MEVAKTAPEPVTTEKKESCCTPESKVNSPRPDAHRRHRPKDQARVLGTIPLEQLQRRTVRPVQTEDRDSNRVRVVTEAVDQVLTGNRAVVVNNLMYPRPRRNRVDAALAQLGIRRVNKTLIDGETSGSAGGVRKLAEKICITAAVVLSVPAGKVSAKSGQNCYHDACSAQTSG